MNKIVPNLAVADIAEVMTGGAGAPITLIDALKHRRFQARLVSPS